MGVHNLDHTHLLVSFHGPGSLTREWSLLKNAYNVRNGTLTREEEYFCACKENNGLGSAHMYSAQKWNP